MRVVLSGWRCGWGLKAQVLKTVEAGWLSLGRFEIVCNKKIRKSIICLRSAHIQFLFLIDLSDWESPHVRTINALWEEENETPAVTCETVKRWLFRIKTSSSSIPPDSKDSHFDISETPRQAFRNSEALFMMWGYRYINSYTIITE